MIMARARLPASLRDVLLARLASVDPVVVTVLRACAIIGREVDERLLASVAGLDAAIVAEAVATAVDRSILVPVEDRPTYRFRHALLAEAVREDLLPSARVDLHRRAARVLRDRPDLRSNAPTVAAAAAGPPPRPGRRRRRRDRRLPGGRNVWRSGRVAWAEGAAAFDRALELAAQARGSAAGDPRLLGYVVRAAFAFHWSGEHRALPGVAPRLGRDRGPRRGSRLGCLVPDDPGQDLQRHRRGGGLARSGRPGRAHPSARRAHPGRPRRAHRHEQLGLDQWAEPLGNRPRL